MSEKCMKPEWHEKCCCNCKEHRVIFKHPWNSGAGKGSVCTEETEMIDIDKIRAAHAAVQQAAAPDVTINFSDFERGWQAAKRQDSELGDADFRQ